MHITSKLFEQPTENMHNPNLHITIKCLKYPKYFDLNPDLKLISQ
jgi:hypothetical protein